MHSTCIEPWTPVAVALRSASRITSNLSRTTTDGDTPRSANLHHKHQPGLMARVRKIEKDVYGPKGSKMRQGNGRASGYNVDALLLSIPEDRHVTFSQWKTAYSKLVGQQIARTTFRNHVNRLRNEGKVVMDTLEGAFGASEFYWRKVSKPSVEGNNAESK
ncbi:hypothetical protein [Cerasicoccus frondis]|uniref:hypothetical protein n=1 Tax=Cerasicoccus frondis TaxID=490090 RepID=UPI0028525B6F|nr:hypothetical protein [Cerasicoccus frondis]